MSLAKVNTEDRPKHINFEPKMANLTIPMELSGMKTVAVQCMMAPMPMKPIRLSR